MDVCARVLVIRTVTDHNYYEVARTATRRWQSKYAQGRCFVDQDAEVPITIHIAVEPPIGFNRYFYGNSTET